MVAMSKEFRGRWEAERVRREEAELVDLARLLMALLGLTSEWSMGLPSARRP